MSMVDDDVGDMGDPAPPELRLLLLLVLERSIGRLLLEWDCSRSSLPSLEPSFHRPLLLAVAAFDEGACLRSSLCASLSSDASALASRSASSNWTSFSCREASVRSR